ncbi:MAG TPA: hypothetical protein VF837_00270 [Patescibacteria group bacterium]
MVQEATPVPQETPVQPTPIAPETQNLVTPETPETPETPSPEPLNSFQPQETSIPESPVIPPVIIPVKETPKSGGTVKILLVGLILILVGILIGVLASNLVPQYSPQNPAVPTQTPTPTVTIEVTPEASPSPTLSIVDQNIIEKFSNKKTTGGIIPDLIQKCNYKEQPVYTLSQTSSVNSPSVIVDQSGKYLLTCGVVSTTGKTSTNQQCDLVSMCEPIWTASTSGTTVSYSCPVGEWVDCMPSPNSSVKPECQPAYLTWAKENCPGFKGAAL